MAKSFGDVITNSAVTILNRAHVEMGYQGEPFDGDITEILAELVKAEMNYQEGNLNGEEFAVKQRKLFTQLAKLSV